MGVVGITGRKFHGKDSAAQILVGQGYTQLRFADPLKEMLRAFYRTLGVDAATIERKIEGDLKEAPCPHLRGKTPRVGMQTLGAEWGRDLIGVDVWIVALQTRAAKVDKAVVSDVRYENECAAVKALGGAVWRIDAKRRVPDNSFSNHSSETAVDALPVDAVIDNNGTPEALFQAVCDVNDSLANQQRSGG